MKIKGCNCWQWAGLTGRKRAFLSTFMFGGWPFSYWPSYPHCQCAPCDGYNPPQLPALSHSRVHRDNCLLRTSLLSFHTTAVKSPLVLTRMTPHFTLSVLGLRSLGMPFLCSLTVPQQKIFFWAKSSYRSGEGKKLSMYSLWPNPSTPLVAVDLPHITIIILIFRAAGGKIWAWRLWYWRLSRRWAWLILRVFRSIIFVLVAVWIHYDFLYLILRQHTSLFYTRNLTFHWRKL